ncbi:30S ribosomal protein S8 [Candidatus Saccharibacteria bacterium]|nr:30S ribosomal protein S8 [Candidatus Saccharibacteria bacterium]
MQIVSTDPIADMLTRIRNAINVRKTEVLVPHSNIKFAIAQLLAANKFIKSAEATDMSMGKMIKIVINDPDSNARITEISRLSTPGRRHYAGAKEIPVVKRGRGIVIVSTSKGLMTDKEARQQQLGGELICKVY